MVKSICERALEGNRAHLDFFEGLPNEVQRHYHACRRLYRNCRMRGQSRSNGQSLRWPLSLSWPQRLPWPTSRSRSHKPMLSCPSRSRSSEHCHPPPEAPRAPSLNQTAVSEFPPRAEAGVPAASWRKRCMSGPATADPAARALDSSRRIRGRPAPTLTEIINSSRCGTSGESEDAQSV
jgi:hypothetical protein